MEKGMPRFGKTLFIVSSLIFANLAAHAAAPVNPRMGAGTPAPAAAPAATPARPGPTSATPAGRSATPPPAQNVAVRSAVTPSAPAPNVAVRAAIVPTQKVLGASVVVAGTASAATVVDQACRDKYFGCMDQFCMSDTNNGGRCLCSNQKADLDKILTSIQDADAQSYKLATEGVEKVQLGAQADYVFGQQQAADAALAAPKKTTGPVLDLTQWNTDFTDTSDVFGAGGDADPLSGKTGDDLHYAADAICVPIMTGCEKDLRMLQTMYSSNIQSDCRAYNNYLTQQQQASAQKLAAAQKAVRDAALESYQNSNKYDLGQCTVAFKQCMMTTAGCGADFTGCVNVAAASNAMTLAGAANKAKTTTIKGALSSITVAASTYDTLVAKRVMCDNVTTNCVAVVQKDKDAVWNAFLAEAAPAVKSAELTAESTIRMNCIGNIADCFQKGCKDTIDPNNPDGSFDMCLTRPQVMFSVCKIPLAACGITSVPTASQLMNVATDPTTQIWNFVVARLTAMRVDSCTTEFQKCLTADTACGKDFGNCIGLDLPAIEGMCPPEKLTGCVNKDGTPGLKSVSDLRNLIQGTLIGIDNAYATKCQALAQAKMEDICGDTASCPNLESDAFMGTQSLMSIKLANGDYQISGLMTFGNVTLNSALNPATGQVAPNVDKFLNADAYLAAIRGADSAIKQRIQNSLMSVESAVQQKVALLTSDTQIGWCVNGRDMSQITGQNTTTTARFPHLLDSYILAMVNSGLQTASKNYDKKFNTLLAQVNSDSSSEIKQAQCYSMASNMNQPRCANWGTLTAADGTITPQCTAFDSGPLDIFGSTINNNGLSGDGTVLTLPGAKLNDLSVLAANGKGDFVMTDADGNMTAKVSMVAVFAPSTNTCTIATTTAGCKNLDAIVTTDTNKCGSGGIAILGSRGGCGGGGGIISIGGGGRSISTQTFHGTMCKEFYEPTTTSQDLKM